MSQVRSRFSKSMASQDLPLSPFVQFESWFKEAMETVTSKTLTRELNPEFASLSTCSKDGQPSSRMVHSRSHTERGITFLTSCTSRKAKDLSSNPKACLLFYWPVPVVRQVRVLGKVETLPEQEAVDDFYSLPRELQISFAVNCEIPHDFKGGKVELSKLRKELAGKYSDKSVPVPKPRQWTAYLLVPTQFEFYEVNDPTLLEIYDFVFTKDTSTGTWSFKLQTLV